MTVVVSWDRSVGAGSGISTGGGVWTGWGKGVVLENWVFPEVVKFVEG